METNYVFDRGQDFGSRPIVTRPFPIHCGY